MASKVKAARRGGTRNEVARSTKRWARTLSRRSKAEFTIPLDLTGVHPSQFDDEMFGYSELFLEPAAVRQRKPRATVIPSQPVPAASDFLPPLAGVLVEPSDKTTVCEKRRVRREVLFAHGQQGGGHKIGAPSQDSVVCTDKNWVR